MPTTRFRHRRPKLPLWVLLGVTGTSLIVSDLVVEASADDTAFPVTLTGAGDTDIIGELVTWQNELFESVQPIDVQYFQRGSIDGRSQLLRGGSDFTVVGVPFTEAELAARPAGAGEIIGVPISVGSTAIVIARPAQTGWETETESPCDPTDPEVDMGDPACATVTGELTGPIRIPSENLGAMIVGLPSGAGGLPTWTHPDLIAALGTSDLIFQNSRPAARPTFLNRTESTSSSKSLQLYTKVLAPTVWAEITASDPTFRWEPVGETFSPRTPSRNGLDTQIGLMSLSNTDPISNSTPPNWTGNMGPVPTTLIPKLLRDNPDDGYQIVEIQNANGDWVTPTRESLDLALAAGTEMNVAADNEVPGAYPLTYINRLYTVAGTLTPDEANALAATIRYVVTDGQQAVIDHGGTDLPDALRDEALAQADHIVETNCTADGYEVTTSGPSAFEPDTPMVQAIASMKHCTLVPTPPATTTTTTTSTTTTTTTTVAAGPAETTPATVPATAYVPPYVAQSPVTVPVRPVTTTATTTPVVESTAPPTTVEETTTTTSVPSTTPPQTTAVPSGGGGSRPRGVALTNLPMTRPDDGSGSFKKLGTLMLGAASFLLARRLVQARRVRA
ncbi:MAG: hypothetical protein HZB15_02680 [Actinobacteria bacterium]|nr:hypothetical protein [Actinomycetota bacterium]